jgi:peptidoglycan/LPS O-acetylase OafA/YrhL
MRDFYIPSLDGLRACAFLLVFVAHAGLDQVVPGGFGVTVFFFLSGYLITSILRLEAQKTSTISLSKFYVRRAFRILPPLYVSLAVGYALGAAGLLHEAGNLMGLIAASTYLFNYTDLLFSSAILPAGIGLVWTLMVEEHFYLIFPLVYRNFIGRHLTPSRQTRLLLGCCLVALIWRFCLIFVIKTPLTTLPRWTYSASDARFDSILFGCILAIRDNAWFGDESRTLQRFKGLFALGGLAVILITLLVREPHFRETLRYTLQSMALYPIFYYCVSSSHQWQVSWLEWKPIRFLGWISYSMYLFHYMALQVGARWYPAHPVGVALISFGITVLYAWGLRIGVELPSRRLRSIAEQRIAIKGEVNEPRLYRQSSS